VFFYRINVSIRDLFDVVPAEVIDCFRGYKYYDEHQHNTREGVLLTKHRDCVLYGQIFELGGHSARAQITLQFDEVCDESRDVWS
jgi:hypothetical protein